MVRKLQHDNLRILYMAITLTPKNSHFSKNLYWMGLPHTNLATDIFLLGKNTGESSKNLAPYGGGVGIITNDTVYSENAALLSETNYLQSATYNGGTSGTVLAVVKTTANKQGLRFSVGNYNSIAGGAIFFYGSSDGLHSSFVINTGSDLNVPVINTKEEYQLVGITIDGLTATLFGFTDGAMVKKTGTCQKQEKFGAVRWGGVGGFSTSDFYSAFGANYKIALTDKQIIDVYSQLKILLANRGITLA